MLHLLMRRSFATFLFGLTVCTVCRASIILGTDLPSTSDALTVGFCCFLSQPFVLTSAVKINSIALQVAGTGIDPATIWLADKEGPGTTPSDVLFQTNQIFPDNGGATSGETISLPTNLVLGPGEYFLLMSSSSLAVSEPGPRPGWLLSISTLSNTAGNIGSLLTTQGGSVNSTFAPASSFVPAQFGGLPVPSDILAFQINGTATPEPDTLFFISAGFVGLLALRRIWLRH